LKSWKLGNAGFNLLESWNDGPWHSSEWDAEVQLKQKPQKLFLRGTIPTNDQISEWEQFHAKCEEQLDLQRLLQVRSCVPW
jgi:hypothetical protein